MSVRDLIPRGYAVAALIGMTCVTGATMRPALAAEAAPAASAGTRTYAIPPGSLDRVLIAFAATAGIDLAFDAAAVRPVRSPGLDGRFSVREGLGQLLDGTGFTADDLRDGGYLVRRIGTGTDADTARHGATLPAVTVQAARDASGRGVAGHSADLGLLGPRHAMDSPVSVRAFDARDIQDQQAYSVADVVENDASVRSVSKPGGILDAFTIRGLPYSNGNFGEIAFDGVYGIASNYRVATGYVERVEVVKGPATMLFGMSPGGSVGGAINIVPKRAGETDVTDAGVDYGSTGQAGGVVDISRRLGESRAFGVRFNGGYRVGDTALDNQRRHAGSGALALDYRGTQWRASLDLVGQDETIDAPFRLVHIVPGIAVPAAPDGHRNISQSWESSTIHDGSALARLAYDLNDAVQLFAHVGGGRTRVARVFAITPTIVNEAGDVSVFDTNYRFDVTRATAEAGMRIGFATGPARHRVAVAFSGYRDQLSRGLVNSATTSLTNLYQPVALPPQSIPAPADVPKVSGSLLSGVSLVDTITLLDDALQATAGARYQRIRSDNFAPDGTVTDRYDAGAVSPMLGVVYRPVQAVSLYANRMEGLTKGDIAPTSASNAGEVLAPYRSTQYEAGVRVALRGVEASLAAFQIRKASGVMTGGRYAADGQQRNRGVEFGVRVDVAPGLRVAGSAMWVDATITQSPTLAGKTPIGVPSLQANLGLEWDAPWLAGLTLSTAMVYSGAQYVDAANTQRVPHWTRWDMGLRYRLADVRYPATLRVTVRNVLDRRGWAAVDAYGGLAQADPRTVLASVIVNF